MKHKIEADFDTLSHQAMSTTEGYFRSALDFCEKNKIAPTPEFLVGFAKTCAKDFHSTALMVSAQKIEEKLEWIASSLGSNS